GDGGRAERAIERLRAGRGEHPGLLGPDCDGDLVGAAGAKRPFERSLGAVEVGDPGEDPAWLGLRRASVGRLGKPARSPPRFAEARSSIVPGFVGGSGAPVPPPTTGEGSST